MDRKKSGGCCPSCRRRFPTTAGGASHGADGTLPTDGGGVADGAAGGGNRLAGAVAWGQRGSDRRPERLADARTLRTRSCPRSPPSPCCHRLPHRLWPVAAGPEVSDDDTEPEVGSLGEAAAEAAEDLEAFPGPETSWRSIAGLTMPSPLAGVPWTGNKRPTGSGCWLKVPESKNPRQQAGVVLGSLATSWVKSPKRIQVRLKALSS